MSMKARHAAIGAFVLGALIIAAIGVAVIFGEEWVRQKVRVLMVFEGNVAGLEVGTPIELRGVRIGEVKSIRPIYDSQAKRARFAVYGQLTGEVEVDGAKTGSAIEQRQWLHVMIEQGLRARLETKSYVTGQQRVMLDFFPDTRPELTGLDPNLPEIPTLRSPGEELVAELREIPFREIVIEGRRMLRSFQKVLEGENGEPGPLPAMLTDIAQLSKGLDKQVPTITREFALTAQETRTALAEARTALADLRKLAVQTEQAMADARKAIAAAEETARTATARINSGGAAIEDASGAIRDAGAQVRTLAMRFEETVGRLDRTLARRPHLLGGLGARRDPLRYDARRR
jgi:paraquat-inducible protein B